jgi:hypothetical protein
MPAGSDPPKDEKPASPEFWAAVRTKLGLPENADQTAINAAIAQAQAKVTWRRITDRLGLPANSSKADVFASMDRYEAQAANKPSKPAAPAVAAPQPKPTRRAAATRTDPAAHYARNPALAELQARGEYRAALAVNPSPPTLFASGDLPPFTASGLDPAILANVPWYSRHALAAEGDRGKALDMYERLTGPEAVVAAADYQNHQGNSEYQSRVLGWAMAGADRLEEQQEEARQAAAVDEAAAVAAAVGPVEDWTDEQAYEHIFGPIDRDNAERVVARAKMTGVASPKARPPRRRA